VSEVPAANMSTPATESTLETALSSIPAALRSRLLTRYRDLKTAFVNAQYDACGLRAGRLCEVLLRVIQNELTGTYTPLGTRLGQFDRECLKLENLPQTSGVEGLRVIMTRALNFLYTLRNKRGIGHEGGDVDANEIDAATAVRVADWCISELIRVVHAISLEEAQALLDAIAEREVPQVWAVANAKRVLDPSLNYREQTLLLLYTEQGPVPVEDLFAWVEHPNMGNYRTHVLSPLHRARLVEYDRETETALLSPTGAERVDNEIVPKLRMSLS
jgi:hypothetical protein